jgi:hypothetical protein
MCRSESLLPPRIIFLSCCTVRSVEWVRQGSVWGRRRGVVKHYREGNGLCVCVCVCANGYDGAEALAGNKRDCP